jgi:hypothetical protein
LAVSAQNRENNGTITLYIDALAASYPLALRNLALAAIGAFPRERLHFRDGLISGSSNFAQDLGAATADAIGYIIPFGSFDDKHPSSPVV